MSVSDPQLEFFQNVTQTKRWKAGSISLFWTEKVLMCITGLEVFGLCIMCFYDLWPVQWIENSKFALVWSPNPLQGFVHSGFWVLTAGVMVCIYLNSLRKRQYKVEYYFWLLVEVLYLPVAVGVTSSSQQESWGLVWGVLGWLVGSLFLVGSPGFVFAQVYQSCFAQNSQDHETLVSLREMEWVFRISDTWMREQVYLYSSFRRNSLKVFHKGVFQVYLCCLAVTYNWLRESVEVMSWVLLLLTLLFNSYVTLFPVYRCHSSNFLYIVLHWGVFVNFLLGFLKAIDYKSHSLADKNLSTLLVVVNSGMGVLAGCLVVVYLSLKLKWPVNNWTVQNLACGYQFLLSDIRNGQVMIRKLESMSSYRFVKPEAVSGMKTIMIQNFKLLEKENHPLKYTVSGQIYHLQALEKEVRENTLLPCASLEKNINVLVHVVTRRFREQILMTPLKKRILLKLLALKVFLGKKKLRPPEVQVEIFSKKTSS